MNLGLKRGIWLKSGQKNPNNIYDYSDFNEFIMIIKIV